MFSRLNDALQTAADVLAPPPSPLQNFEYHWKHVKNFYAINQTIPKVHINNTNLPGHLEEMLKLLIEEENNWKKNTTEHSELVNSNETTSATTSIDKNVELKQLKLIERDTDNECFQFMLSNRPLDLLANICITDSPPGATVCILNWVRRFLSCLQFPRLEHKSIHEPILKLVNSLKGTAGKASPYEREEIMFLLTVAGVVRKDPVLLNLFLPMHVYTLTNTVILPSATPKRNTLFESVLNVDTAPVALAAARAEDDEDVVDRATRSRQSMELSGSIGRDRLPCDCRKGESLVLFDTIVQYFDSADSLVVVRACEAALILVSLPSMIEDCCALDLSFTNYASKLAEHVGKLCQAIPDDMDNGDIEDCAAAWGLLPRDAETQHFIGRPQLTEFLCWLDYVNCVSKECSSILIAARLADKLRFHLFESSIEPAMLEPHSTAFALVLASKVINKIDATEICDHLALWLVGPPEDGACVSSDCLLNILIENAQDNLDILLPTLQFVEALLDNAHELILHSMLFRYLLNRGYYDAAAAANCIKSWSDEEEERERKYSNDVGPASSSTLRPSNILRVINNFLLLLPRQIMSGSIGTCYEEYVQDANRHYKHWLNKTANFDWPIEATCPDKDDALSSPTLDPSTATSELKSCDSGIAEEVFYEGTLLRLLFTHVRNMDKHPYELNIAVIAILSKLAFLPHPYLHEVLLNPELPIARGTNLLWSSMQTLARHLLLEIPRIEGFHKRINETATRLLVNPPMLSEDNDPLFESLIALEEFCKELAAIAFVKYHHATE